MVWVLLGQGADLNAQELSNGCGPLHFSSQSGHLEEVHLLVVEDADVRVKASASVLCLWEWSCRGGQGAAGEGRT